MKNLKKWTDRMKTQENITKENRINEEPHKENTYQAFRICPFCGAVLQPNGTCWICPSCGTTTGCS